MKIQFKSEKSAQQFINSADTQDWKDSNQYIFEQYQMLPFHVEPESYGGGWENEDIYISEEEKQYFNIVEG